MNFRRELHNAYQNAGIPIICLRHAPAAYPPHQLRQATRVAQALGRGLLLLLEDPDDAQ